MQMFLYLQHAYEVKYFDLCFTHAELRHGKIKYLTQAVQEICGRGSYDSNSVSVVVLFHSRKIIFLSVATLFASFILCYYFSHSNYDRN